MENYNSLILTGRFINSIETILIILIILIGFSLVLYYFTGANKKATYFMVNLATTGMNIFTHMWMFILIFVGSVGLYNLLNGFLKAIFIKWCEESSYMMLLGILILTISGALIYYIKSLRKYINLSMDEKFDITYKFLLITGLFISSFIMVFSGFSLVDNTLKALMDFNKFNLSLLSLFISIKLVFFIFLLKLIKITGKEDLININ